MTQVAPGRHRIEIVEHFDIAQFEPGTVNKLRLSMIGNGMGALVTVPVVVVRGAADGPTVGLTAAVHGNELNGMRVIQRVLEQARPGALRGTLVCVPVVNVPGYLNNTRQFNDGADLNRVMPGRPDGTSAQVYAYRFVERVVTHLDYLLDLHTASFGRINTLYVRADMRDPITRWMAKSQHPQIMLHNPGVDGTLRGAAMDRGVKSITVEVGNPNAIQSGLVHDGVEGVLNVLARLDMIEHEEVDRGREPVACVRSYWTYTNVGGVLEVYPGLAERVRKGEVLARVRDIFGDVLAEYRAPEDGIVIGRSIHPVNQTGSRIVHLGIEGDVDDLPAP